MSTTRDDLISRDGFSYQWVIAIEGYDYLITDGPAADAVTAWAATPWNQALSGLSVMGDFDQSLDAFEAFSSARSLSFSVMDCDDADRFGVDVSRPALGAKTWLSATVDASQTTINVQDTAAFTASGTIYIGNERITYSGKTSTSFTGCTRGVFAPFNRDGSTSHQYGVAHEIPQYDGQVSVYPRVTQNPQSFVGRWVGVWMHRSRGGVLDVKAEAILIYAGRISDIRDSANGLTTVACTDLLDAAKNCVVLRDQFECRLAEGIYLLATEGVTFYGRVGTANFTKSYSFTDGRYTLQEFIDVLNEFASTIYTAANAANLTISFNLVNTDVGWRVECHTLETGAGNPSFNVVAIMPARCADFIGFSYYNDSGLPPLHVIISNSPNGADCFISGQFEPLRVINSGADPGISSGTTLVYGPWVYYESSRGTLFDQTSNLPQAIDYRPPGVSGKWGLFYMAGRLMKGCVDEALQRIARLSPVDGLMETRENAAANLLTNAGRMVYSAKDEDMIIKQVVVLEGDLRDLLIPALCSTSVAGYAHADHDSLGANIGAGIPYEPMADLYESVARIDEGTHSNGMLIVVEKPTTIRELFNADLIMRQAFLNWHNGSLCAARWAVPRAAMAIAHLTEDNKAGTPGDPLRSITERTDRSMRNVVKIEYNRIAGGDKYESSFEFVDAASVQNYGGARAVTIKARNSYGGYATTGETIQSLAPSLLAMLPMFSRPVVECVRTIDHTLYEKLYVGAVVKVTDNFMRDPSTGLRGIIERSAIVSRIRFDFGGMEHDAGVRSAFGEVTLIVSDTVDGRPLCPSAVVDYTFGSFGYTAGYDGVQSLRTVPKEFNASGQTHDLAAFSVGDRISIVEINPNDPASAISIDCTITAIASLYYLAVDVVLSSVGFVAGREYKIVPRGYSTAISAQQGAYTFLADSNSVVAGTLDAFTYGEDDDRGTLVSSGSSVAYMTGGKIAETTVADNAGPTMDVSTLAEMMRAINHLCDARMATVESNLRVAGLDADVMTFPVYVSAGSVNGRMRRNLAVSAIVDNNTGSAHDLWVVLSDSPVRQTVPITKFSPSVVFFSGRTKIVAVSVGASSGIIEVDADFDMNGMSTDGMLWLTLFVPSAANVEVYGASKIQLEERTGI